MSGSEKSYPLSLRHTKTRQQMAEIVGAEDEIIIERETKRPHLHDAVTPGGLPIRMMFDPTTEIQNIPVISDGIRNGDTFIATTIDDNGTPKLVLKPGRIRAESTLNAGNGENTLSAAIQQINLIGAQAMAGAGGTVNYYLKDRPGLTGSFGVKISNYVKGTGDGLQPDNIDGLSMSSTFPVPGSTEVYAEFRAAALNFTPPDGIVFGIRVPHAHMAASVSVEYDDGQGSGSRGEPFGFPGNMGFGIGNLDVMWQQSSFGFGAFLKGWDKRTDVPVAGDGSFEFAVEFSGNCFYLHYAGQKVLISENPDPEAETPIDFHKSGTVAIGFGSDQAGTFGIEILPEPTPEVLGNLEENTRPMGAWPIIPFVEEPIDYGDSVVRNWKSFASGDLSEQITDSTGQISSLTAPGTPLDKLSGVYKARVVSENGGALMEFWDISTGRYYGVRGFDPNGGGDGVPAWTPWSVVDSEASGGAVGISVSGESVTAAATGINFVMSGIPLEYSAEDGLVTLQFGQKLGTPTYPLVSQYTALDGEPAGLSPDSAGVFYTQTTGGIAFDGSAGATAVKGGFLDGHLPENCYFAVRFSNDQNREFNSLIILSLQDKITHDMSGDPDVLQSFIMCVPGSLTGGSEQTYAFSIIPSNAIGVQLPSVLSDTTATPEFGIELAGADTYIHIAGVKTKIHDAGHLKALYLGGGDTVDPNNTVTRTDIVEPSPGVMAALETGSVLLTPYLLTPAEPPSGSGGIPEIIGTSVDGDGEAVLQQNPALWDLAAIQAMCRKYAHIPITKAGNAYDTAATQGRGIVFQDSPDGLYKLYLSDNNTVVRNPVDEPFPHKHILIQGPEKAPNLKTKTNLTPYVWAAPELYNYIEAVIERISLAPDMPGYFTRSVLVGSDGATSPTGATAKLPGVESINKTGVGTYEFSFNNATYAGRYSVTATPTGPFAGAHAGKVYISMVKQATDKWIVSIYEISTGTPVLADASFIAVVTNSANRDSTW